MDRRTYGDVLYSRIQAGDNIAKELIFLISETRFGPNGNDAIEYIASVIKQNYVRAYNSWKEVPESVRQLWFAEFQKYYVWTPKDHFQIYKNFKDRARNRLKDLICYVRDRGKRPTWINEDIWNDLCISWNKAEFKERSDRAKKNRASNSIYGPSLHTGENIPFTYHIATLAEEFGRPITPVKLHVRTHQNSISREWIDKKSEKTFDEYARLKTSIATAAGDSQIFTLPNEVAMWTIAAGGKKSGGSIYGLGSVAHEVVEDPIYGYNYGKGNNIFSHPSAAEAIYPGGHLHPNIKEKLKDLLMHMDTNDKLIFEMQREIYEYHVNNRLSSSNNSNKRN